MIAFADSISPEKIPDTFTHVASYSTGRYVWPPAQLDRFPRHIEIAVLPGDPGQAKMARALDVERCDAGPGDVPPFLAARRAEGHRDGTVYCSINTIPAVLAAAGMPTSWRLWVAWFWQRPFPPTAGEVLAEIRALTGISLPVGILWACQWSNGTAYDTSVLYGVDDFTQR